jgi:NAD(P)-dependent dehydrogenase (short-subunit alcohol dehydrogenase family)
MKVLITGATDGHGRALAQRLAADGATVLVHGRDQARGEQLVAELSPDLAMLYLADFGSLAGVRDLAARIREDHNDLDVLVNNAGIGTTLPGDGARMESADGYELRFAVNYLSGYLLTRELLALLRASAPSRIVNVASAGQEAIDFDDVMLERAYDPGRAYRQSKLAQVMFTFDLADELTSSGLSATCLHPATFMPTTMVLHARGSGVSTIEQGVEATARLVTDPDPGSINGRYFNGLCETRADPQAYDSGARRRLHELSERLVG